MLIGIVNKKDIQQGSGGNKEITRETANIEITPNKKQVETHDNSEKVIISEPPIVSCLLINRGRHQVSKIIKIVL